MSQDDMKNGSNGFSNGHSDGAPKVIQFPKSEIAKPKAGPSAGGPAGEITFKEFAFQVQRDDMVDAAGSLSFLFSCSGPIAAAAAAHFKKACAVNPDVMFKTMGLKGAVEEGKINPFMDLINECFGISGPTAIEIFQHLSKTLAKP